MALEEKDFQRIRIEMINVLEEHIPTDTHLAHHDWVKRKIEKDIQREKMLETIKQQLAVIGVTGIVASAVAMIIYAVKHGYGSH